MGAYGQAGGMMGTRFGTAPYGTPLGNLQLQTQGNPTYGPSGVNNGGNGSYGAVQQRLAEWTDHRRSQRRRQRHRRLSERGRRALSERCRRERRIHSRRRRWRQLPDADRLRHGASFVRRRTGAEPGHLRVEHAVDQSAAKLLQRAASGYNNAYSNGYNPGNYNTAAYGYTPSPQAQYGGYQNATPPNYQPAPETTNPVPVQYGWW